MNIFITGATGFIGKALVNRLLEDNHKVTSLLLPGDQTLPSEGSAILRGDITDPESLAGKIRGHDVVVHLAGAVGYSQKWKTCIALNRQGTHNVVSETIRTGVRRFVHMSSVSVYGRVPEVPIDEDFPLKKIGDPYGDTKIAAEQILRLHESRREIDLTVIRPTVIYGPGDTLFLPRLIENLKGEYPRIIGNGRNTVDLIHVTDVAEFVSLVIRTPGSVGKTYNLTHPGNPTWKALLTAVASVLGVRAPEKRLPYRLAMVVAIWLELVTLVTGKPPRLTRYAVRNVGRQYRYLTDRMQHEFGFTPAIDTLSAPAYASRMMRAR